MHDHPGLHAACGLDAPAFLMFTVVFCIAPQLFLHVLRSKEINISNNFVHNKINYLLIMFFSLQVTFAIMELFI